MTWNKLFFAKNKVFYEIFWFFGGFLFLSLKSNLDIRLGSQNVSFMSENDHLI